MEQKIFYYARVSSKEQNLDRQLDAFKKLGANDRDIITDKQSGKNLNRPGYNALKYTLLRSGDTLVILSLDRLSRNKEDIKDELEYFRSKKIRLKILDLPTTTIEIPEGQDWIIDMVNNILIEVYSSIAEQERLTTKKRQQEGIEAAKARGKHLGRPKTKYPDNWNEIYNKWKANEITAVKAISLMNLKKSTFYNLIKKYEIDK